jgi:photosystem II stability/assembly factor-like uncharacterized protein
MKKLLFLIAVLFINSNTKAQWTAQSYGFPKEAGERRISSINIVDPNTVWALPVDGDDVRIQEFTKTIDGGKTWIPGKIDISNPTYLINSIYPTSATTAFITAVSPNQDPPYTTEIWKTTDGGKKWEKNNATGFKNEGSYVNGVHFFDANNGISFGDPTTIGTGKFFEIYSTSNGGDTWKAIPAGPGIEAVADEFAQVNQVSNTSAGDSFWIGTNKGNILHTSDKGATWEKLKSPIKTFTDEAIGSSSIRFSDKSNGIIWFYDSRNSNTTIYNTSNGGATWTTGTKPNFVTLGNPSKDNFLFLNFCYIPNTTKLIGIGGYSPNDTDYVTFTALSNDNGKNWEFLEKDKFRFGNDIISFYDKNTGWASAGSIDDPTKEGIFKFDGQTLSISNFNTSSTFSVSPIPTTGNIKLSSAKSTIGKVTIHNVLVKEVFNNKFSNLNNEVNIDLSGIDKGIYFLKATAQSGAVETIKVIKE